MVPMLEAARPSAAFLLRRGGRLRGRKFNPASVPRPSMHKTVKTPDRQDTKPSRRLPLGFIRGQDCEATGRGRSSNGIPRKIRQPIPNTLYRKKKEAAERQQEGARPHRH